MKDEDLIRHAYDQVVNYGARLFSFASGRPLKSDGPLDNRQKLLALDDLAAFAYHARRLMDLTGTKERFLQQEIPGKTQGKNAIGISRILNVIVHSERIEILRTEFDAALLGSSVNEVMELLVNNSAMAEKLIPVTVIIKSDHSDHMTFKLEDLIERFQEKILARIIEVCDKAKIYLDADDY